MLETGDTMTKNGIIYVWKEVQNSIGDPFMAWVDIELHHLEPDDFNVEVGMMNGGKTPYRYHPDWKPLTITKKYPHKCDYFTGIPVYLPLPVK